MSHPIEPYEHSSGNSYYQEEQKACHTYSSIMKDATLGAMVGATAAAAIQLKNPNNNGSENAFGKILGAGVASGLATAAASAVGNSMGQKSTLTTIAAMFATGTAMMYLLGSNTNNGDDEL